MINRHSRVCDREPLSTSDQLIEDLYEELQMDFDLALAPGGSYAVLTNYEDVSHASAIERQRAMNSFAAQHCVSRFLVDTRGKRFVGSVVDLYSFVRNTLPKEGFDKRWKVALLTSPDDDSHDFLETASFNAGYEVRVFKHPPDAIVWLDG